MNPSDFDPDAAAPEDAGLFGLPFTPEASRVVILPVPFEATTSYGGGTANGPEAVLAASHQVDLFDLDGRQWHAHLLVHFPVCALALGAAVALDLATRALAQCRVELPALRALEHIGPGLEG